ncbi:monovalent cation/H(+) antiporter subunit G [Ramlibacter tataouinensis]|uniref:Candidate multisubunit Na+/H+ antiporter, MnhG subunit n=1 Tax=Ramlibacter tataouinensis (strain ATCC BAA-407 / DSM 14655 / LMG 21543 / TTB310) TaxID=365046 RepID=F5XWC6_RAMTT|nr:monovalent cation/H(+) antiporter subunit G [Ramlibacter tataouinensis]AEG91696.1 Candidate multisubunit Na+/H+ antiporter, MnhG subunit [Ramlibacter tataouinensis TTB310]
MSILTGVLVLAGALLALAGSVGLLRLKSFYERVHPPTMGSTLGTGLILIACIVHFSGIEGRLVLHHLLIGVFMTVTTPVTYMMLVRAALHRDAAEGRDLLALREQRPTAVEAPPQG